jgi:predicted CopG family antitoxin
MGKSYAESPLGKNIALVLHKIGELKRKYPLTARSPVEHTHATMLVNLLEEVIHKVQHDFVPKFDNANKPSVKGILGMMLDVFGMRNLPEKLKTRNYTLFLDLEKALPSIINDALKSVKKSSKDNKPSLSDEIIRHLELKKKTLFENAATIPGSKDRDVLFKEIEQIIRLQILNLSQYIYKIWQYEVIPEENHLALHSQIDKAIGFLSKPAEISNEELTPLLLTIDKAIKEYNISAEPLNHDTLADSLLRSIKNYLLPQSSKSRALTIAHPMTFELADLVVTLIHDAPELNELIPFFDHDALSVDLTSTAAKLALSPITKGATFRLENKRNEDGDPTFIYDFTEFKGNESRTYTYNGKQYYNHFRHRLLQFFVPEFENYFSNYAHTLHAANELERLAPLREFLETETTAVKAEITAFIKSSKFALKNAKLATTIDLLDEAIEQHHQFLAANQRHRNNLSQKDEYYQSTSVTDLLPKHSKDDVEQFDSVMRRHDNEQPDYPCYAKLACKYQLSELVTEQIAALSNNDYEVESSLDRLISARKSAELQHCEADTTLKLALMDELQQTLDDLNKENVIENDVAALEAAIEAIPSKVDQVKELERRINEEVIAATRQLLDNPKLPPMDPSGSLQQNMALFSNPVLEKAKTLLQKTPQLQQKLDEEKQSLLSSLEQAKYNASLSTANPETLRQMLQDTQESLQEVKRKKALQLQEATNENAALREELERLPLEILQKKEELRQLAITKWDIIKKVQAIANVFSGHSALPDENTLMIDQEKFIKFLQDQLVNLTTIKEREAREPASLAKILKPGTNIPVFLDKALKLVCSTKKSSQIFNELNNLPELGKSNFGVLLPWIGTSEATRKTFNNYRTNFFPPSEENYTKVISELRRDIGLKQIQVTTLDDSLGELTGLQENYISIAASEHEVSEILKRLGTLLNEDKEKFDKMNSEIAASLALLEQTEQQHTGNIEILTIIIDLLDDISKFRTKIEAFEPQQSLNEPPQTVTNLKRMANALEKKMTTLSDDVARLGNAESYQGPLNSIKTMINANNQKIRETIHRKLDTLISEDKKALNDIDTTNQQLIGDKEPDNEAKLAHINTLLTGYTAFSEAHAAHRAAILQLIRQLTDFDKDYVSTVMSKQAEHNALLQSAAASGRALMDYLLAEFNKQADNANVTVNSESNSLYMANAAQLESVSRQLAALPTVETLTALAKNIESWSGEANREPVLEAIQVARKAAEDRLNERTPINSALGERVNFRIKAIGDLSLKLDAYLQARAQKYKAKDFFSSQDKDRRTTYINTLKTDLDEYQESGDSTLVLKSIRENISLFPGVHLQALLNECTAAIIDMDRKIPADYNVIDSPIVDFDSYHSEAKKLLAAQENDNAAYVNAIRGLYEQVTEMSAYGAQLDAQDSCAAIVADLANKLKYDIDYFVTTHSNELPNEDDYTQFKENFTARLHSKDDVMSVHNEAWKPIVANFVIGFFTLGIALGIKLLHSKISSGRCSFFFDQSNHLDRIEKMEQALPSTIAACA